MTKEKIFSMKYDKCFTGKNKNSDNQWSNKAASEHK